MLKVVFLGRLADAAGAPERALEWPEAGTLAQLLARVDPALAGALSGPRVRLALNGVVLPAEDGLSLAPGDELAFLPPVSGG